MTEYNDFSIHEIRISPTETRWELHGHIRTKRRFWFGYSWQDVLLGTYKSKSKAMEELEKRVQYPKTIKEDYFDKHGFQNSCGW